MKPEIDDCKIGIIGLGYVGLPLAVEFGKQISTIGFDIKEAVLKNFGVAQIPHWRFLQRS